MNGDINSLLNLVENEHHHFDMFRGNIEYFFQNHPRLKGPPLIIHSVKSRNKAIERLEDKLRRKMQCGEIINSDNIFHVITDIAGVRVLHLYQDQFTVIHECINDQISRNDWILHEHPKAYTWDPEAKEFFESHGLRVEIKESFYTSIHYVVRPREESILSCEIQVRTLFEEIWGEVDHLINYPYATDKLACREMLRVLARLVSAGSRLVDSIFRTHQEKG